MPLRRLTDGALIDEALYPDETPPAGMDTLSARVDYLSRLCAAWDFGILPQPAAVDEVRQEQWREAVDVCRLLTSPAYHLLRKWHGLDTLPYLGKELDYIRDDPTLV